MRPVRILHLSDLHEGYGFQAALWDSLQKIAVNKCPHLVIVSGDFVNTPWRWTLRRAKRKIESLIAEINTSVRERSGDYETKLLAVPGNHDVRLSGLVPINWMKWGWLVVAMGLIVFHASFGLDSLVMSYGLCTGLGLLIYGTMGNFRKVFADYMYDSNPAKFTDLGLLIYSFDSASRGISAARGIITIDQFDKMMNPPIDVRSCRSQQDLRYLPAFYKIAVVHHHPLPIPYENPQEPLMILDNAGAFINELAKQEVRLVLHGHRHRRHCSRITINVGTDNEHEVAVLSAGSPTTRVSADRLGFSFNLIELDILGHMNVTPYETQKGGVFGPVKPFETESRELTAKRAFLESSRSIGRTSTRLASLTEVSTDGDLYRRIERHKFRIIGSDKPLTKLGPISAETNTGHIELFKGGCLDGTCSGLKVRLDPQSTDSSQSAEIDFGGTVTDQHPPIDYFYHYYALNAVAMSVQQYREMYDTDEGPSEEEWISLVGTPVSELLMMIKLPRELKLGGKPELVITNKSNDRQYQLMKLLEGNLVYYQKTNVIIFTVEHPPLDMKYAVRWQLTDNAPPLGRSANSRSGKVHELAKTLLKLSTPTPSDHVLWDLMLGIEQQVTKFFVLEDNHPIDLSIMAYDTANRNLKVVCANFFDNDPRWSVKMKYGDGIPGRAYKMNKPRLFVKLLASQTETPLYYRRSDGQRASAADVPGEVTISIPLNHKDDPNITYGVLNICSHSSSSKLVDLKEENFAQEAGPLFLGINNACFEAFEQL